MPRQKVRGVGEVARQRRQTTGTVTSVHRTKMGVPGKEPAYFKLICEDHGEGKDVVGWNAAQYQSAHPELWCPGCRQQLGMEPIARLEDGEPLKAQGNHGVCWGCGTVGTGLVTLRHVDDPKLDAPLCPLCFAPGSTARQRWQKRAREAFMARKANWRGLSKEERRQRLAQLGVADVRPKRGRPPKAEVPLLEHDEEAV